MSASRLESRQATWSQLWKLEKKRLPMLTVPLQKQGTRKRMVQHEDSESAT